MKSFCLSLFLSFSLTAAGQSVDGTYVGAVLTSKNVVIITTLGNLVIGSIYLNENNKLAFTGTLADSSISGKVALLSGEQADLVMKTYGDSIMIQIIFPMDPAFGKLNWLKKYSSNPKEKLSKIFGKHKVEYDTALIGTWYLVKSLDSQGKDSTFDEEEVDYSPKGAVTFHSKKAEKIMQDFNIKAHLPSTWETSGSTIIIKLNSPRTGPSEFLQPYYFRGDTLVNTLVNKKKMMYLKKSRLASR